MAETQRVSAAVRHDPEGCRVLVRVCAPLQMKAALGKDSRRLKAELDAAKVLLRTRMQRAA